jgi:hypothetical protein
MSQTKFLLALDRAPRFASLVGLLGLIGLAGVIDPQWYRFSALSFLSYLCYLRFFRRFVDPDYGPTAQSAPVNLLGIVVLAVSLPLNSILPMFGFFGFAGTCGLYDSARTVPRVPAA